MSTRCAGCILLPAQWRGAWVGREAGASMWGAPQEPGTSQGPETRGVGPGGAAREAQAGARARSEVPFGFPAS